MKHFTKSDFNPVKPMLECDMPQAVLDQLAKLDPFTPGDYVPKHYRVAGAYIPRNGVQWRVCSALEAQGMALDDDIIAVAVLSGGGGEWVVISLKPSEIKAARDFHRGGR